ncbi:DNA-directed RNA polymerase subunit omega, partial [Salmonella enterica]|uniref:DNA-directed RNA polymerase subunit omega n=1 Tax=Salmonella enterica TaxID=28901 RepID=UPI0039E9A3CE
AAGRQLTCALGGKEPKVAWENDKPTVVALREIASGLVDYDVIAQDEIVDDEPLFTQYEEEPNEDI